MKPGQIIVLAIVLGVLLSAVIFQKTRKPPELQTQTYSTLGFDFDATQAAKIVIQKGTDEKLVELSKEENIWRVTNFLNVSADQQKIENFLKRIQEAKGELRAKDKSLFSEFKIGDEEAFQVIVLGPNGEMLSHLLIGSKWVGGNASFVRKSGADDVYYAQVNLFGSMGFYGDPEKETPKSDHWVSLKPLNLNPDQLEGLEIRRLVGGKETISASVLRETDPADSSKKKWKYTRTDVPFALDAEKVKQFLTTASNWYASKALNPNEKDYGFVKPTAQVKLVFEGQKEVMITAVQESEGTSVYVQITGEPAVYEYSSSFLKHLESDDSKFFVNNPLAIESADKVEKLTIKTPERSLNFSPKEKKWDSLANYINNDLKNIAVKRLLFDSGEQKKAQSERYSLQLVKEGEQPITTLQVGEALPGSDKEYPAKLLGNGQPFAISEATFKIIFDNLDRLAEPKS